MLRISVLRQAMLQIPASRNGHAELSLARLKILQEVITLTLFVPFVVFYGLLCVS